MENGSALAFQVLQGVALAACAGLRAFLPLFILGVAARLEWVRLAGSFEWLASSPALVVFGVAVVLELLADKIPLVDNILDLVQFVVKPVAGTLVAASVVTELTPLQATVLAIVTGGLVADLVHLAKTKLRLVSTSLTAGTGNPVLSVAEDGGSLVGSLVAIFAPVLIVVLVAMLLLLTWRFLRSRRARVARAGGR